MRNSSFFTVLEPFVIIIYLIFAFFRPREIGPSADDRHRRRPQLERFAEETRNRREIPHARRQPAHRRRTLKNGEI